MIDFDAAAKCIQARRLGNVLTAPGGLQVLLTIWIGAGAEQGGSRALATRWLSVQQMSAWHAQLLQQLLPEAGQLTQPGGLCAQSCPRTADASPPGRPVATRLFPAPLHVPTSFRTWAVLFESGSARHSMQCTDFNLYRSPSQREPS